jgi:hypothetical protein
MRLGVFDLRAMENSTPEGLQKNSFPSKEKKAAYLKR